MDLFSQHWWTPILIIILLIDGVLKAIGLWKSARNNHLVWFIFIAIFNTIGILPLVYILMHRNKTIEL